MEDRGWRMEDGGSRMKDGGWRIEKSLVPNLLGPKLRACELIETRPVFRTSNKDLRQENGRFFQFIHKLSAWARTSAKLCFGLCGANGSHRTLGTAPRRSCPRRQKLRLRSSEAELRGSA